MSRSLVLGLASLICAVSAAAHAQSSRQHLPAIAGVPFGSSFASAQAQLGPGFKAGTAPKQPDNRTLTGRIEINGQFYIANFTFNPAGVLDMIFAVADTPGGDDDACHAQWGAVRASVDGQLGPPDTQNDDQATGLASAKYAFKDGSKADAARLGCLIAVTYKAGAGKAKTGPK